MKIFHIVWGLGLGGIETMVVNIANVQAQEGHDVALVVVNDVVDNDLRERISKNVNLLLLNRHLGSKSPLPILKLNWLIAKERPEVVHFHDITIPRLVWKPLLKKWCATHHTVYHPELEGVYDKIPKLFSISKGVQAELKSHGHESTLVYNGIRPETFAPHPKQPKALRPLRIIQVGRIYLNHKAQDLTLEAVKLLTARGTEATVDFIGTGPDAERLKELIENSGIKMKVNFIGAKTQYFLSENIGKYDLAVHPSRFEGFGLAICEAMAAKVPVLVSDITQQMEVIDAGNAGFSFKTQNIDDFADKIEFIANNDVTETVENAYCRTWSTFNVENTAKNYLKEYNLL